MTGRLILGAYAADAITFAIAVAVVPIAAEINPTARWLYAAGGVLAILASRLVVAGAVLAIRQTIATPVLRRAVAAIGIGVPGFGAAMNLAAWTALR